MKRFHERAMYFTKNEVPDDDWNRVFVMQHFGVPTRLLDWSENALVALWFALKNVPPAAPTAPHDAAVWVLDPVALNRESFSFTPPAGVFSVMDRSLEDFSPGADLVNKLPVSMYGMHNNPRIVAQRGTFTVAGADPEAFVASDWMERVLKKIVVPSDASPSLASALKHLGMTESMVFPDLDGLARELKSDEGY